MVLYSRDLSTDISSYTLNNKHVLLHEILSRVTLVIIIVAITMGSIFKDYLLWIVPSVVIYLT